MFSCGKQDHGQLAHPQQAEHAGTPSDMDALDMSEVGSLFKGVESP
jgi:hypothetical protein